jgi:hypothetical protein
MAATTAATQIWQNSELSCSSLEIDFCSNKMAASKTCPTNPGLELGTEQAEPWQRRNTEAEIDKIGIMEWSGTQSFFATSPRREQQTGSRSAYNSSANSEKFPIEGIQCKIAQEHERDAHEANTDFDKSPERRKLVISPSWDACIITRSRAIRYCSLLKH